MLYCYLNMNHLFINQISLHWIIRLMNREAKCGLWLVTLHFSAFEEKCHSIYLCFPLELCFVSQGLSNSNRCYLYISDPNILSLYFTVFIKPSMYSGTLCQSKRKQKNLASQKMMCQR